MTNRPDPAAVARPILAIETGSRSCSVAILHDAKMLAHERRETDHGHATMLMPMIEQVRAAAGIAYTELERIAVAVGPGSFTGLRVGIAAALGLSLASGVPAVGVSSFHVAAAGTLGGVGKRHELDGFRFFVLLDSRRDEPFFAELDRNLGFLAEPAVMPVASFDAMLTSAGSAIILGDAPAVSRPSNAFPEGTRRLPLPLDATMVAVLAGPPHRYDLPPKPIYVRAPDVTMPRTT
jgi:tRNA threonylcarbamoyladenosine biosynthesis protein TsaB